SETKTMEIRQINILEAGLVTGLFDQYRIFYNQPSDLQKAQQFIADRRNNNESVIFASLLKEHGAQLPAGCTQLYPHYPSIWSSKNWILNDWFVATVYRKQGIGEALIQKAFEYSKAQGAGFVQLETQVTNTNAQKLYERIGFQLQPPDTEFLLYRYELG